MTPPPPPPPYKQKEKEWEGRKGICLHYYVCTPTFRASPQLPTYIGLPTYLLTYLPALLVTGGIKYKPIRSFESLPTTGEEQTRKTAIHTSLSLAGERNHLDVEFYRYLALSNNSHYY